MGQAAAKPFNDNLAFAANSLDFLSGSRDLISIRGKGNSVRPFAVVKKMEAAAAEKYKEKLTALEARINEVQAKLTELQGKTGEGGKLLTRPPRRHGRSRTSRSRPPRCAPSAEPSGCRCARGSTRWRTGCSL